MDEVNKVSMYEVNKVSIPLCRYEELLDIETRVNVLVDQGETVAEEDIYLILGYVKKYKAVKDEKEKKLKKFLEEMNNNKCQESELATESTEAEKASVVQNKKSGEI